MSDFLGQLFDTADFTPWERGNGTALHGWTHIIADAAVFGAYTAIPLVLGFFIVRCDMPFPRVFWLFVAFIFSCGFGHLIESSLFWMPWYRFSASVKVCTAVVSWATVLALIPVLPRALALPGLGDLPCPAARSCRAAAHGTALSRAHLIGADRHGHGGPAGQDPPGQFADGGVVRLRPEALLGRTCSAACRAQFRVEQPPSGWRSLPNRGW